ncbi:MAG: helix-turn-helix transcriptional regulator [bacterium]|nr:helix-turn-helix transcriptional regulator [bacterium]
MDRTKRKRLEARGWKIGDAADFLSLSPEEAAYVELKLSFCQNLKNRRKKKQLTQAQLAKMIKSSQSRVAKMEAGDPTVSLDLLVRSLLALGISKRELARAISTGPVSFQPTT